MISRRRFLLAAPAALLATPALAGRVLRIPRDWLPTDVEANPDLAPGVIHVDTGGTWLYLITGPGTARRYKIAVGAPGRSFRGRATVGRKAEWPSWIPTADMIRQEPAVYGP